MTGNNSDESRVRHRKDDVPVWSAWRHANHAFFREKLAAFSRDLDLVDLGAGALQFEDIFLAFRYTGVDFIKFPHVSLVTDLTKDIPLESGTADIITLSNTVEHIPNTQHLFAECYRLLRNHGVIVGTIPFLMPVHQAPHDFNRYTNFHLVKLLQDVGFTDVEVKPLGRQMDAYNTIELKTFDELYRAYGIWWQRLLLKAVRTARCLEMRVLRVAFQCPATNKVTEGYGFSARKCICNNLSK
jgi:SAM-dependent methyltransferase